MSDNNDKDSKTEEATSKRVEDAFDKGNMPTSREVGLFATILALTISLPTAYDVIWTQSVRELSTMFDRVSDVRLDTPEDALNQLVSATLVAGKAVFLPLVVIMVLGILAAIVQHPIQLVGQRIKPDFSRISLSGGIKRLLSRQNLVEFAKTIAKFALVTSAIFIFLTRHQVPLLNSVMYNPNDLADAIKYHVTNLFALVAVVMAVLVAADVLWSRFKWHADLRMSKQEIKDEQKQAEGDPIVRARQRSLARDRSRRRMVAAVPRATMVIANPTHYAVALRYVRSEGATPIVIAKGMDNIALKIRETAGKHNIPVIEDKALARSLYAAVVPDRPIPPEFYKAVAEIVLLLMSRNAPVRKNDKQAA